MQHHKALITKYLDLYVEISHVGLDNHSKINATEQTANDFEYIIQQTMSHMYGLIRSWEDEHKDKIEQVGK